MFVRGDDPPDDTSALHDPLYVSARFIRYGSNLINCPPLTDMSSTIARSSEAMDKICIRKGPPIVLDVEWGQGIRRDCRYKRIDRIVCTLSWLII